MKNILLAELNKLTAEKHVFSSVMNKFRQRLDQKAGLLKHENLLDHFCVFFLPYHQPSQSVYLGHHIKADDWISPGGHIEENEHPIDSVRREFLEELKHQLSTEPIKIFDITVKYIDSPLHSCKVHWDLWYLVKMKSKPNFAYIREEYYQAQWFKLKEAVKKITKNPDYKETVKKLFKK